MGRAFVCFSCAQVRRWAGAEELGYQEPTATPVVRVRENDAPATGGGLYSQTVSCGGLVPCFNHGQSGEPGLGVASIERVNAGVWRRSANVVTIDITLWWFAGGRVLCCLFGAFRPSYGHI